MKIFLDIDGVMVHANPQKQIDFDEDGFYIFNTASVRIIKSLIQPLKDELILSTTHRFRYTIPEWKEIFSKRGIDVSEISIVNLPITINNSRKDEIMNWIFLNDFIVDDLIIIDDDKSLNELPAAIKSRLVLTNSYTGLIDDLAIKRVINRIL